MERSVLKLKGSVAQKIIGLLIQSGQAVATALVEIQKKGERFGRIVWWEECKAQEINRVKPKEIDAAARVKS